MVGDIVKKNWKYILIVFLVTLILGSIITSIRYYGDDKKDAVINVDDIELKPIAKDVKGINVSIDPRIELLSVVQALSDYDRVTDYDFTYKKNITEYFSQYSNHEAVKTFNELNNKGSFFHLSSAAMLYLSNPLELKKNQDFDQELINTMGEESLNRFALQLKDFAVVTKFNEFYEKNRDFYKQVVEENAKIINQGNYIMDIENYYGMKQHSYNIILAPMFDTGGYATRKEYKDGIYDIYSFQGTVHVQEDIPIVGDKKTFEALSWHEFGHSFVDPITVEYLEEINKYNQLYEPIADKMKKESYGNWESCVNEHIIRAIILRFSYLNDGKKAYDDLLYKDKNSGFAYVEELCKRLEEYENDRENYKNFKEFYPQLIEVFKELNEENLDEESH